jgi:hypothetical protein
MIRCHGEPTLKEALSDPMTRAVMDADGVDPRELERRLNEIAASLRQRSTRQIACPPR